MMVGSYRTKLSKASMISAEKNAFTSKGAANTSPRGCSMTELRFSPQQFHQLRQELQVFVHDIPRRERTIGHANIATVHQMRELDRILDDFKEAIGWKE